MPKASTFTPHIASQMVDSDRFPFIPNAGGNGTITVTEFRDVVGLGWGFTINAARFSGISDEAKIQAAINHAVNVSALRVFVPSSMLPYDASLVTFNDAVQMVREGGSFDVYDVLAYGAAGDGVIEDTVAIQSAIDACHAAGGGTVYCPSGTYLVLTLSMPGNNISIVGAGSAYAYNTSATIRTKFKAMADTVDHVVFNLAVTGDINDRTGCLLSDFEIDGDLTIWYGIKCSAANLIQRVRVRGCLVAGIWLANYTNATRVIHCGLVDNFAWGLKVDGSSTTTFSVIESNLALNNAGGALLEAGVLVHFARCVFESNSGPAVQIYKPDLHTGSMGEFTFANCWLEDNALTAPHFSLTIDAETRTETIAPWRIRFSNCRFAASQVTRKYASIMCAKWVTFEECQFSTSTESDTFTFGAEARLVAWIECEKGYDGAASPTDAQFNTAIAAGTRCYRSARDLKHLVDTSPAFQNSWVNFGGALPTAKFWFDRESNVHLEGTIKDGTINTVAFTLPVGYRPATTQKFAVISNGAIGELEIQTDGDVLPVSGSNVSFNLNGAYFTTG